jgi:hypothetical protein
MNILLRDLLGILLFGNSLVMPATAQPDGPPTGTVLNGTAPFVFPKGLVTLWQAEFMCPVSPARDACTVTINGNTIGGAQQLSLAHVSQPIAGPNVREFLFYRVVEEFQNAKKVHIGLLPFAGGVVDVREFGLSQTSAGNGNAGTTMPYAGP